jgi:hypothetical protein
MDDLSVWICFRYKATNDDWMGALLIAAPTQEKACQIFNKEEGCDPEKVIVMKDVSASGQPRIVYNDYTR